MAQIPLWDRTRALKTGAREDHPCVPIEHRQITHLSNAHIVNLDNNLAAPAAPLRIVRNRSQLNNQSWNRISLSSRMLRYSRELETFPVAQ